MSVLLDLALPFARLLDPETAHSLAIRGLARLPAAPAPADDPALATELCGLKLPNPVGLAAGFDKEAEVPDAMLGAGFGFVEVGTITPRPQPGNPRPRNFRLVEDRAVINRYGFNSGGHALARARLGARRGRPGIVGVNVGANKDASDRTADYVAGIEAFAGLASYFTANVSSPNTPGLRDLQEERALDDLLGRVLEARDRAAPGIPLFLKIAPDLSLNHLDGVVQVAKRRAVDGVIVSNTTISRPSGLKSSALNETGGLSGRPLFPLSTRMLAETFLRAEGAFPLIGAGGIDSAETALSKIEAGASAVQLYSALVYEGLGLVGRIKRGLSAQLAKERRTLPDLVGRGAKALTEQPFPG